MEQKTPRRLSLRYKFVRAFILFGILAIGVTATTFYVIIRRELRQDFKDRLRDMVSIASLKIDGDLHTTLRDPSQEDSDSYRALKKVLQNIRDAGADIQFVYTMRLNENGDIQYVVDAEENEDDLSHLGDIYDPMADPMLTANIATMSQPMVDEDFTSDEYGTYLSGFAPIYTSDGKLDGIIGIDISADTVLQREKDTLLLIGGITILVMLLVVLLGILMGSQIAKPLSVLSNGAEQMASGNLHYRFDLNTRDETEGLANSLNVMADKLSGLISDLELRVQERTQSILRKSNQLQASAYVAREAAQITDAVQVLNNTVNLITERFGYYHCGLFIIDEQREYAVLQVASSEGGKQMLDKGHRLRIGAQGIVGFVAAEKKPRIALDVGSDAVFFNNPYLPLTRSEMALPLIVREKIIGVLDIQSDQSQAFTEEDVSIMQILTDQLAVTIENAQLLSDLDVTIQQLKELSFSRTQEAWLRYTNRITPAYQYTLAGVRPVSSRIISKNGDHELDVPITLRGQPIGVIHLKRKASFPTWSEKERGLVQKIAEQAALALDSSRLVEEIQRNAQRDQLIANISSRLRETLDVDSVVRTAAIELQRIFDLKEAEVSIGLLPSGVGTQKLTPEKRRSSSSRQKLN